MLRASKTPVAATNQLVYDDDEDDDDDDDDDNDNIDLENDDERMIKG